MYEMKVGEIPGKEQLISLYADVGWTAYTRNPDSLLRAVKGSYAVYTVWFGEELVALLRVVGDGESIAYVQDLLVKEAHQRKGLGSWLLTEMEEDCLSIRQKILMTEDTEKTVGFYRKNGWQDAEERSCRAFLNL